MLEIIKSLLIAFFAVAVLLPVVRYALRRLSPAYKGAPLTAAEQKYMQKQELKLTVVYFIFACVLSVFSAGTLALVSSIIHHSSAHLHTLTPNFRAFFAPGLLLGLTLAGLPLRWVQPTFLSHDYDLYKTYTSHLEGLHSNRIYNLLLAVMLVISGVVTWYALQWHVTIGEEKMEVTNLLLKQRTYNLRDIQRIQYLGADGEYLISFNDQTNINTTYLKPVTLEMIALLSAKSGKRVIR
ncbi:hypothetical protein MKJ04_03065 [Pontibacter sp. E15-1]|uniref:hypothetical protein n=1 Tax=Pontibacter sp. E15-1 TaxID=2919918 RepID=UPI001F4F8E27|nr:hypothetical protein [Pontibacter sp. E15-1]MCJ8163806.1 hypothetical protein [Pontibacter sp. E15-1]